MAFCSIAEQCLAALMFIGALNVVWCWIPSATYRMETFLSLYFRETGGSVGFWFLQIILGTGGRLASCQWQLPGGCTVIRLSLCSSATVSGKWNREQFLRVSECTQGVGIEVVAVCPMSSCLLSFFKGSLSHLKSSLSSLCSWSGSGCFLRAFPKMEGFAFCRNCCYRSLQS